MTTFRVGDMTCGHCASILTRALAAVHGNAEVTVDVARYLVTAEQSATEARTMTMARGASCSSSPSSPSASPTASLQAAV